jgi:hypothetical protein
MAKMFFAWPGPLEKGGEREGSAGKFQERPPVGVKIKNDPAALCRAVLSLEKLSSCCHQMRDLFSSLQNFKILQDSPSHRIFQYMHEVLNVAKQNN